MEVDFSDNSYWQHLPPVILTEIFSDLSLPDRFNASLVCRAWAQAFYAPQIWRSFTFQFEGSSFLPSYDYKAIQFAKKFGCYARRLNISCRRPSYLGCRRVHSKITSFFTSLRTKTQLTHLSIRDFNFKRDWRQQGFCEKILTSINQFLRTQFRLCVLDLRAMDVRLVTGVEILRSALTHCSGTVEILLLEDFIHPGDDVAGNEEFKHLMNEWKMLSAVSLNYSMLDDDFLSSLVRNNAKNLEKLRIKCRKRESYGHCISNLVWINVLKMCPNVKISLVIERVPKFCQFRHLLQKNIPLQNLRFFAGYEDHEEYWGLIEFISYLKANFSNTLETLDLDIEDHIEFVDDALVDLISSCSKLSNIEISAILHIFTVDVLCSIIIRPKSGVRKLHLTLSGLAENDITALHNITEKYIAKLNEKKIEFRCITDWAS